MTRVLSGLPGFFVIHVLDRGFNRLLQGPGVSFLQRMAGITAATGGRVVVELPISPMESFKDNQGQVHPVPPTPPNMPMGNILWDLAANSSRLFATGIRSPVEWEFGSDWAWMGSGSRKQIPQQLLRPYGKQPTPGIPKIMVSNYVLTELRYHFRKPHTETFPLPGGLSYSDVTRSMVERLSLINWLDPLRTGSPSPFGRHNIFARPTIVELRQGLQRHGGVRLVDCLDPAVTGFPQLTIEELNELGGGPYQTRMARSYLSNYRVQQLQQRNQGMVTSLVTVFTLLEPIRAQLL